MDFHFNRDSIGTCASLIVPYQSGDMIEGLLLSINFVNFTSTVGSLTIYIF